MRSLRILSGMLFLAVVACVCGCDSGGLKEGTPDVDMSKTYTPPAAVNTMSPKDYAKSRAAQKAAAASAPAAAK